MTVILASVTAKPTLKQLLDVLSDKVDWYVLGIELDIPPGTLDTMKEDHGTAKRCLTAMLSKWLNMYPDQDWTTIVETLRKMDYNNIANTVTEKYCSVKSQGIHTICNAPHYNTMLICTIT